MLFFYCRSLVKEWEKNATAEVWEGNLKWRGHFTKSNSIVHISTNNINKNWKNSSTLHDACTNDTPYLLLAPKSGEARAAPATVAPTPLNSQLSSSCKVPCALPLIRHWELTSLPGGSQYHLQRRGLACNITTVGSAESACLKTPTLNLIFTPSSRIQNAMSAYWPARIPRHSILGGLALQTQWDQA